jgi:hypothetical protein
MAKPKMTAAEHVEMGKALYGTLMESQRRFLITWPKLLKNGRAVRSWSKLNDAMVSLRSDLDDVAAKECPEWDPHWYYPGATYPAGHIPGSSQ